MRRAKLRRILGLVGLMVLALAFVTPWPISLVLLISTVLWSAGLLLTRPKEPELAAEAREAEDDPDLMNVWEVAEAADMPMKKVVLALDREGVPRADAHGWRARLPVSATNIRYRRSEISDWLATRDRDSANPV